MATTRLYAPRPYDSIDFGIATVAPILATGTDVDNTKVAAVQAAAVAGGYGTLATSAGGTAPTPFAAPMRDRGPWQANTSYSYGDVVTQAGVLYVAPSSFTSGGSFVAGNWTKLGTYDATDPSFSGTYAQVINAAGYVNFDGTDETTGLTAALTAAAGKTLWIPAGKTVKTQTISPAANTRITGGGTIDLIDDATATSRHIYVNKVDGVSIDGVTVTMSNATGRTGVYGLIRAEGATNLVVRNNTFGKSSSVAVYVATSADGTVQAKDVLIHGNKITGPCYADGIHICRGAVNVTVLGNTITGCQDDMIAVNSVPNDGAVTYPVCSDVSVIGNRCYTSTVAGSGVAVYGGTRIVIAENQVISPAAFGIVVTQGTATNVPSHVVIRGNTVRNTGGHAIKVEAVTGSHSLGMVVDGNIVDPVGAFEAILLHFVDGSSVTGNRVVSGTEGIHLLGCNNCAVTGNTVTGISGGIGLYFDTCAGVAITGNNSTGNNTGLWEPNTGPNLIVGNAIRGNTTQILSSGVGTVNASNLTV